MVSLKQRDALFWIAEFVVSKRYAPTYQEIADGLGYSSKTAAHGLIQTLKRRGFIETAKGARSIWITQRGLQWIGETKV